METIKNYKQYFINNKTFKENQTIKTINTILKHNKSDIKKLEQWEKSRLVEYLTENQTKLLYDNKIKELKALLKKYKIKALEKQKQAKIKALEEYNTIKQLKDIKEATFEIEWTGKNIYGYQCKCIAKIKYKNGSYKYYESERTNGCGYDKSSTALSYALNNTAKILLIKHGNKILKDTNKHYNYYACENMYFSYGVGLSSYITMFKNMGYKVQELYHHNEDTTIIISK